MLQIFEDSEFLAYLLQDFPPVLGGFLFVAIVLAVGMSSLQGDVIKQDKKPVIMGVVYCILLMVPTLGGLVLAASAIGLLLLGLAGFIKFLVS